MKTDQTCTQNDAGELPAAPNSPGYEDRLMGAHGLVTAVTLTFPRALGVGGVADLIMPMAVAAAEATNTDLDDLLVEISLVTRLTKEGSVR